jgi:dihydrodipicolinate synthase/N-acetylneuraminate lyase
MGSFDLTPYKGVFPAAMTFFDADGNLDEQATREHWLWLAEQGIDGIVVAGTSGEFISLKESERERLIEMAVADFRGKIPVIAGTGHASTKLTIETSQRAQDLGADAFIVILPYYSRPPAPAVLEHFRILRRHTDRPIMLYNNPANTACAALSPLQIADLVADDVVHMVKSTMESVVPVHDLALLVGDDMRIFYGSFLSAFEAFAAGAHGWISGVLNVATEFAIAMHRALAVEMDLEKGRRLWERILPIVHLYTYQQVGPVMDIPIYRSILNLWGRHGGFSRDPFFPLDESQCEKLRLQLEKTGWLPRPRSE